MRLCATDLGCRRGGRDVFADVGFALGAGELLAVTGRNGAGKSSLLRMIAGLVRIAAGKIVLEGGDPDLTIGEQAHYVGHQDAIKPALSVAENLRFWTSFYGGDKHGDGAMAALEAVGLDALADLPVGYLSAGQRRRLSLARLRVVPRPIWLLDEPTSALDAGSLQRLAGFMQEHLGGGGLIVVATHGPIGIEPSQRLPLDALTSPQGRGEFGGTP